MFYLIFLLGHIVLVTELMARRSRLSWPSVGLVGVRFAFGGCVNIWVS